jgi:CHAT domain-containing protein
MVMPVRWLAVTLAIATFALASSAFAQADPAPVQCAPLPADPGAFAASVPAATAPPAVLRRTGEQAWQRGDFTEAAACWLAEARAQAEAAASAADPDATAEIDALLRTGQALFAGGKLYHARGAFELAGRRARLTGDARGEAQSLGGLGATYLALGAPSAAEFSLDEALAKARTAGADDLIAALLNERGNLYSRTEQPAPAAQAYAGAERAARELGDTLLALRAGTNGARALVEAGTADAQSDAKLDGLLNEVAELPDSEAKARLQIHLGRTLALRAGQVERSTGTLAKAARVLGEAAETAERAGARRSRSFALGYLGALYEAAGRREEALELTRRASYAAEVADAPDALYRWQWQAGRILRSEGRSDEAIASYRAATATLERLRGGAGAPRGGGGAEFVRTVKPVYDEMVDLLLVRAAHSEHPEQRQALLLESRGTLEDLKAAELRDYFRDECVDAQRREAESIPGSVVVYPIVLPDRLELVVSDETGLRSFRSEVTSAELDAEVRLFRALLEKRTTNQYRAPAKRLYTWLIEPLEPLLEAGKIDALVFVPGDALRTIPMAALVDPDSGQFLIEKVPIAITPGLTLMDPRRIDRERTDLLAAGLTEARQGYPALAHVGQEIDASRAVFPEGRSLIDEQFVARALQQQLEETPFGIVHIASHGEFGSNVDKSFLLTYDDRLSVNHLADLVGATRFRGEPLELLTLSACDTAAGDDRAALGLAGVALRAGARSAVATLWSINDEVSAELISEFYVKLANPELSRAEALQAAQIGVLRAPRTRHPAYWSPFLLISNWL